MPITAKAPIRPKAFYVPHYFTLAAPPTGYYRALTVDHTKVPSNQTDFAVLVNITDTTLKIESNGGHVKRSDGFDIRFFANSDATGPLKWEMESYDGAAGTVVAWVKIANLSSSVDTIFYMLYGDAAVTTDQSDKLNVWDSNYKGVYHLATTTTLTAVESTSHAHPGTPSNVGAVTGQIGQGADFNGTNSSIDTNSIDLASVSTTDFTLEYWVAPRATVEEEEIIAGQYQASNFNWFTKVQGEGILSVACAKSGYHFSTFAGFHTGVWHQVTIAADASGSSLYVDGALDSTWGAMFDATFHTPSAILTMGRYTDNSLWHLKGSLDEVRLSSAKRSADWVAVCFNNQSSPGTFETIGSETAGGASSTYKRTVTVDHTKVPSTQSNFPVLVKISDATFKSVANGGHVQSGSGFDIRFFSDSAETTALKWEIEKYDASTGDLLAWVKIASLSSSSDTVFYCFYGNSGITSTQADPPNVWDSNFQGVWHMNLQQTGTAINATDSTSNANNGTLVNTPTVATGKIGGGMNLASASSEYVQLGSGASLNITGTALSVSAWVKMSGTGTARMVATRRNAAPNRAWQLSYDATHAEFVIFDGTNADVATGATTLSSATWYYLVGTKSGTGSGSLVIYLNGSSNGTFTSTRSIPSTTSDTRIGDSQETHGFMWDGDVDEFRISSAARSADWITTEYNNQNSPGTFMSLGSEVSFAVTQFYTQSFTATTSFAGLFGPKAISHLMSGTLSFAGSAIKKIIDSGFTAALSFLGNLGASKTFLRALSATLSFAATTTKRIGKVSTATLFPAGEGNIINTWPDSSGNGNNATKVGSPTLRTNVVGGQPVVRFTSATSDGFNLTTPVSGADPWTIFAVMKAVDSSAMLAAAASTSDRTPYLLEWPTPNLIMTSRDTYQQVGDYSGAFHVIMGSSSGGGVIAMFVDGTNAGPVVTAYGPYTGNFDTIGYRGYSGPVYPDGDIAEILIYNATISGTNRQNVEAYLGNKYGITVAGGTPVNPSTISGLQVWFKADSLSPATATLIRRTSHLMSATLSRSAALIKGIRDAGFTATLSFTGLIAASKSFLKSLTATLSFVGSVTAKIIATRAFTATLSFAGASTRRANKAFTAALSNSAALVKRIADAGFSAMLSTVGDLARNFIAGGGHAFTQALSATLSSTAALARLPNKAFSATLAPLASLVRRITRTFTGTLSTAGVVVKAIRDAGFTAALSFAGNLVTAAVHFFTRSFTATLSFVGNLTRTRTFARALAATLVFSGAIRRQTGKSLSATVNFVGAIRKRTAKLLSGAVHFIGFLFRGGFTFFQAGQKAGSTVDIVVTGSSARIQQTGSQLRVERTD